MGNQNCYAHDPHLSRPGNDISLIQSPERSSSVSPLRFNIPRNITIEAEVQDDEDVHDAPNSPPENYKNIHQKSLTVSAGKNGVFSQKKSTSGNNKLTPEILETACFPQATSIDTNPFLTLSEEDYAYTMTNPHALQEFGSEMHDTVRMNDETFSQRTSRSSLKKSESDRNGPESRDSRLAKPPRSHVLNRNFNLDARMKACIDSVLRDGKKDQSRYHTRENNSNKVSRASIASFETNPTDNKGSARKSDEIKEFLEDYFTLSKEDFGIGSSFRKPETSGTPSISSQNQISGEPFGEILGNTEREDLGRSFSDPSSQTRDYQGNLESDARKREAPSHEEFCFKNLQEQTFSEIVPGNPNKKINEQEYKPEPKEEPFKATQPIISFIADEESKFHEGISHFDATGNKFRDTELQYGTNSFESIQKFQATEDQLKNIFKQGSNASYLSCIDLKSNKDTLAESLFLKVSDTMKQFMSNNLISKVGKPNDLINPSELTARSNQSIKSIRSRHSSNKECDTSRSNASHASSKYSFQETAWQDFDMKLNSLRGRLDQINKKISREQDRLNLLEQGSESDLFRKQYETSTIELKEIEQLIADMPRNSILDPSLLFQDGDYKNGPCDTGKSLAAFFKKKSEPITSEFLGTNDKFQNQNSLIDSGKLASMMQPETIFVDNSCINADPMEPDCTYSNKLVEYVEDGSDGNSGEIENVIWKKPAAFRWASEKKAESNERLTYEISELKAEEEREFFENFVPVAFDSVINEKLSQLDKQTSAISLEIEKKLLQQAREMFQKHRKALESKNNLLNMGDFQLKEKFSSKTEPSDNEDFA